MAEVHRGGSRLHLDVRLVGQLGTESLVTSDRVCATLRATPLRKGPSTSAAVLEGPFPRAHWCHVVDHAGEFSQVVYEELDLNAVPQRVIGGYSGWVESSAIAEIIERHFFHFEALGTTPERWVQHAEQRFECHWVPLQPKPALMAAQQGWLDTYYERL